MPTPKNYATFLAQARNLANRGEKYTLRLMLLLVEVEEAKAVWQGHPHKTWPDVLREERLCTPSTYEAFKKAVGLGINVEEVGVEAACLLAKKKATVRSGVLRKTMGWIKTYKVPPRYQLVSEYVRKHMKEHGESRPSKPSKAKRENEALKTSNEVLITENEALKVENLRLKDRIKKLVSLLRQHEIPVPRN